MIDLDAARPARVMILPGAGIAVSAAGAGPTPGTLLLGGSSETVTRYVVTRYAFTATGATRQATVTVPGDGLVEAFSPDGRHVLYLRNHGPVQLWAGAITATGVSPTTELLANADLGSASWL